MRSAPVLLAVCLLDGAAAVISERDIFRTPGIRLAKVARQSEKPHSEKGVSVGSVEDNIYVGDITVGDKSFLVQLDTGSSDLWLDHSAQKIEALHGTYADDDRDRKIKIDYALGSVVGRPAYGPVALGAYRAEKQLLLSVESASNIKSLQDNKISGMLGFGLESSALIPPLLEAKDTLAPTFLGNVFAQSPNGGNFTTWYLGRGGDGLVTITELPEPFAEAAVAAPSHAVWKNPKGARWAIELPGIEIGGKVRELQAQTKGTPDGPAIVVLDTGSSLSYMPKVYVDAVYSSVNGARYAAAINAWLLPCASEVSLAFNFKDLRVPLNPLDVVTAPFRVTAGGKDVTICTGALRPFPGTRQPGSCDDSRHAARRQLPAQCLHDVCPPASRYLLLPADRPSMHYTETPSVQMLNITNEQEAMAQYAAIRAEALKSMPPEADLSDGALVDQIVANLTVPAAADPEDTTGAASRSHVQAGILLLATCFAFLLL